MDDIRIDGLSADEWEALANPQQPTNEELGNLGFDAIIKIPKTNDLISPILSVIPLQFLAYYISKEKGLDVDKPRNLAKSVTVE